MEDMPIWIAVLVIVPSAIALGFFALSRFVRGEHLHRSPLREKLARFPGYTLMRETEKLEGEFHENFLFLVLAPCFAMALGFYAMAFLDVGLGFQLPLLGITLGACAYFGHRLYHGGHALQRKRRGLAGEMVVGEHLKGLLSDGFSVFHDFPAGKFNIDHIVVGRVGVFAVETKYRRKRKGVEEKIRYDGKRTHRAGWDDLDDLKQATRQAEWLRKWLSERGGVDVPVRPVLSYPGWDVERENSSGTVWVMKPSQICRSISTERTIVLAEKTMGQVNRLIADRCTDVEF